MRQESLEQQICSRRQAHGRSGVTVADLLHRIGGKDTSRVYRAVVLGRPPRCLGAECTGGVLKPRHGVTLSVLWPNWQAGGAAGSHMR